ncbi:cytochrome P450 [Ancistrocladus abbreviatus]
MAGFHEKEARVLTKALANAGKIKQLVQLGQLNVLIRIIRGRRLFGDGTGISDPKADKFKEMVVELTVLVRIFNTGGIVRVLNWLDLQGIASKMMKLHNRFDRFLGGILEEHKAKGHVGGDKQ